MKSNTWVRSKDKTDTRRWRLAAGSDTYDTFYAAWTSAPAGPFIHLPKMDYEIYESAEGEHSYTPLSIFESINDKLDTILALIKEGR
jgi:hypothetical protein